MTLPASATVTHHDEISVVRRIEVDFEPEHYREYREAKYLQRQPKVITGLRLRWDWDFTMQEWKLNAMRVVTLNVLKDGGFGAENTNYLTADGYKDLVLMSMIGGTYPLDKVTVEIGTEVQR